MMKYKIKENSQEDFARFLTRLTQLHERYPQLLTDTLANIFSMRFIGNKTHGDLGEIAITEFVNKFMYDYNCVHVGKMFYRSGSEADILLKDETQKVGEYIPVSLKAYGSGPLQLSTDKESSLFKGLSNMRVKDTVDKDTIKKILQLEGFKKLTNVLPFIYEEKNSKKGDGTYKCNILVFDIDKMMNETSRVVFVDKGRFFDYENCMVKKQKQKNKKKRLHPVYIFLNENNKYICEVRYGGKDNANALQRGFWSDTKNASTYFKAFFKDWISYDKRDDLIQLFQHSLVVGTNVHKKANEFILEEINKTIPSKDYE